jgi:hypothetical protein
MFNKNLAFNLFYLRDLKLFTEYFPSPTTLTKLAT